MSRFDVLTALPSMTRMNRFGGRTIAAALLLPALVLPAACGASGVVLQSQEGGTDASLDAHAGELDAGALESGPPDAGVQDADASDVAARICGDLPERALTSLDDVKAALTAGPGFPGGWLPCTAVLSVCPLNSPAIKFDDTLTTMRCGTNLEQGFVAHVTLPMVVVDTGSTPRYALHIQTDASTTSYALIAQGQIGGSVGITLTDTDAFKVTSSSFEPLQALP